MRRVIAGLLALILAAGLTACGGSSRNYTAENLNVWIWDEEQLELWQGIADQWTEKSHVSVTVSVKPENSYWSEIDQGVLPDVMWMDNSHIQRYVSQGSLMQLDEAVKSSGVSDQMEPELTAGFRIGEHTYGIPATCSLSALWYQKGMLASRGLSEPDDSWTWETLTQAAEQLTNRENGSYGMVLAPEDTEKGWYHMIYSYGGSLITESAEGTALSGWQQPETLAAMDQLSKIILNAMPSQTTLDLIGSMELFRQGHAAMTMLTLEEGEELIRNDPEGNWDCAVVPYCDRNQDGTYTAGERAAVVSSICWSASAFTADRLAVQDLTAWLSGAEAQKALAESGLALPARKDARAGWTQGGAEGRLGAYTEMLEKSTLIHVPQQTTEQSWEDHAVNVTMYVAWNQPERMATMLMEQDSYTQQDLIDHPNPVLAPEEESAEASAEEPEQETEQEDAEA